MTEKTNQKNQTPPTGPRLWEIRAVKDLMWLFLIILLLIAAYYLRSILLPIFLGLLLAYLFNPTIMAAKKRLRIPKQVTVLFLLAVAIAAVIAVIIWLIPPLIEQGTDFVQSVPDYWETLRDKYGVPLGEIPKKPGTVLERLHVRSESILPFVGSVIGTSVIVLFWVILIPVSFFVFSMNFNKIVENAKSYIPQKKKGRILHIFKRMDKAVGNFFRGRLFISLIIAVLFSAGWFLAGVPYWFLLGIATGFLSIVPYLSTIGWIAVLLVKYLEMTTGPQAPGFNFFAVILWPTVVYQGVNVLEEYVLTPWIQSKSTTLNPLTILVVVFVGGWIGGLLGLLFAIPVAACIKIFWEEVISRSLKKGAQAQ
ncbi:MAG: AI-2E family transporter [Candidatus Aminicenantes bacterium]